MACNISEKWTSVNPHGNFIHTFRFFLKTQEPIPVRPTRLTCPRIFDSSLIPTQPWYVFRGPIMGGSQYLDPKFPLFTCSSWLNRSVRL